MKSFESVGTICLKGQNNFIYKICKITYRLFEDESFEYVFEPNYFLIDLFDSKYFQGISISITLVLEILNLDIPCASIVIGFLKVSDLNKYPK